jgi:hypothetical protein
LLFIAHRLRAVYQRDVNEGGALPGYGPAVRFGRIVLLLVAAATVVVAASLAKHGRRARAEARATYACPMHPEVAAPAPGACPICGMALEGRQWRAGPLADAQEVAITSGDGRSVTLPAGLVHGHHLGLQTLGSLELDGQELEAQAVVDDGGDVIARMYPDEAAALGPGAAAAFVPSGAAAPTVDVRLVDAAPAPAGGGASAEVRFRSAVKGALPRVRAVGRLRFSVGRRRALVIPLAALIESPDGPYVLTASNDGRTFMVRQVEVGRAYPAFAVVLAGAHPGDRIAVMDAFFIDAERRLRSRSSWRSAGPEAPP